MPAIELKNITKKFTSRDDEEARRIITAVDDVSLKIKKRSYNTLLGPSGCGKTTLLRMIAGLEQPTEGKVIFDHKDVTDLPPEERNIGFVFQNYALFPHMDVWHNVSYGPMIKRFSGEETKKTVEEVLKMVKLDDRARAYPSELSGGMQQRVAVARALATKSPLMLLDEPLGALDVRIGTALRYDLVKLIKKYKLTAIHVTHNQEEAMTISDNVIMMKRGRVIQTGTPEEIYDQPNSIFSAYFLGRCNFLRAIRVDNLHVKFQNTTLTLAKPNKKERVVVGVRPEKVHIDQNVDKKHLCGTIEFIDFLGDRWQYTVEFPDGTQFKILKHAPAKLRLGDKASVIFYPENAMVFDEPENFEEEKSV